MQTTDTHFVIRVPRFAGYKTLFVNGVIILAGLAAAVWPKLAVTVDPTSVGAFYDTMTGALVALIGVVNVLLRLMTNSPAAPWTATTEDSAEAFDATKLGLARSLMPGAVAGGVYSPPGGMTVKDALRHDAKPDEICTFPDCGCHQRCEPFKRRGVVVSEVEPVVQLTAEEQRRDKSLRQTVATFLVPFLLIPAAFVGVTALAGCGTVQEVNAVASAATLEQRAFALYGTYTVLEERGADLVRDTSLPKAARKRIQAADRVAKPLADQVRGLAVQLNAARMAYQTAATGDGGSRVLGATQALQTALTAFAPALEAMTRAVNDARY